MLEIIFLIVLVVSIIGIGVIVFRKIPVLADFSIEQVKNRGLFAGLKEKIKNNITAKTALSSEALLLKLLSKTRVLFLKGESKVAFLLSDLRQKSIEKKKGFSDNYWDKLKAKRKGRKTKIEEDTETENTDTKI